MSSPDGGSDRTERLVRSWDANADAWRKVVQAGAIESRRLATDAAILDSVARRNAARVLDVGCGEGWLSRALADQGLAVVGIDASISLIKSARAAGGAEYRLLSFDELAASPDALGSRDFDVAVCNFALLQEHIDGPLQALRGLLRTDGALIIQTMHPWTVREHEYADGWREEQFDSLPVTFPEPMPWFFRTLGSWSAALRQAGFVIIEIGEPQHPDIPDPLSLILVAEPTSPTAPLEDSTA